MARIRDEHLYRATHSSFKSYCKEKWEFTDSRARQIIDGAKIAKKVESVTGVTLSNEKQTRPLGRLPEEERSEAWNEAVELADGKDPTVKQVEQVVRERLSASGEDDESERMPEEPSSRPLRKGEEKPDYGKCPSCAGTKWKQTDDGVVCAKCQQPHGESVGDPDEGRIKTQCSKTIKTAEALMRAIDDLHLMRPRPHEHAETIATCKIILKTVRGWK